MLLVLKVDIVIPPSFRKQIPARASPVQYEAGDAASTSFSAMVALTCDVVPFPDAQADSIEHPPREAIYDGRSDQSSVRSSFCKCYALL